ncbi:hypothetical protein MGG_16254 [Pyricularia oryzae 70-15]|uniref:Uncharacterized protein n=2 Tax=Pyricularia oryzae TaxID=318829 RepID=G4MPV6_PYRO7|nr:uncharacterized protein MGG_16254 [Pyricularia oryzae 70-15]EHA57253.1 hypothetical protein MGG_16254 [Pyricularia oryzae 70-15]
MNRMQLATLLAIRAGSYCQKESMSGQETTLKGHSYQGGFGTTVATSVTENRGSMEPGSSP